MVDAPEPQQAELNSSVRSIVRATVMAFNCMRLLPGIVLLLLCSEREIIRADLRRWAECRAYAVPRTNLEYLVWFIDLMSFTIEYRNVFYLRLGWKAAPIRWLCKPLESLGIGTRNIGPGLFVQHGIATLISAERIGSNFWVNQHVTIGYSNWRDRPTIGNNVTIRPGAQIVGRVRIGDNATVGLNTVVLADVPPNTTVFGVPGKIIAERATPSGALLTAQPSHASRDASVPETERAAAASAGGSDFRCNTLTAQGTPTEL
jgi:serine O-acetyltransferase